MLTRREGGDEMFTALNIQPNAPSLNIVVYQTVCPHLRELLSQGVLAGASTCFVLQVWVSFLIDNYYKMLVISGLPKFLAEGAVIGLVNGFAVWLYGQLFGPRLLLLVRLTIAGFIVTLAYVVLTYGAPSTKFSTETLQQIGPWAPSLIVGLGLTTGSRLRPFRVLSRGLRRRDIQEKFPAMATRLLLGVALLFGWFECTLLFICLVEMKEEFFDHLVVSLVVGYFTTGIVIILGNLRFWLTVTLAIVINAPWVFILLKFFSPSDTMGLLLLGYLVLWCGFLLTHWSALNPLFSSIRNELRYYYLID